MSHTWRALAAVVVLAACSGSDRDRARDEGSAEASGAAADTTESRPLMGDSIAQDSETDAAEPAAEDSENTGGDMFTVFTDPVTGFATDRVHDADREVVHFDPRLGAMIWSASGDAVSGWSTSASDLSWSRSGVAFQVRFGTELGERRAYFTETAAGTICDLNITAPEQLTIFGTSEPPPEE